MQFIERYKDLDVGVRIENKSNMWYNKREVIAMEFVLSLLLNCVGYLIKPVINIFRPFKVTAELIECNLGKPRIPDGEGGFTNGSRINFKIEIINKKDKKHIISKICCRAMCRGEILQDNICCYDRSTYRKIAFRPTYEQLLTIDVSPESSAHYDVLLTPGGDLSECDKLILFYKKGIINNKIIVWAKDDSLIP